MKTMLKLNKLILSEIDRTREIMGLITEQGGTPGWTLSVFNTHCGLGLGYISVQVNPGSTCNASSFNWSIEDASGTLQVLNPIFQGTQTFGSNGINTCPLTPGSSSVISSGPALVNGTYTFRVISNTGSCPNPNTPLPISQSFTISNCGGGVDEYDCVNNACVVASPGQFNAGPTSQDNLDACNLVCQPTNSCPSSHAYHSWPYGYDDQGVGSPQNPPYIAPWPQVNIVLATQFTYCEWCADFLTHGGPFDGRTSIWVGGPYDESACDCCPPSGPILPTPQRPSQLRKKNPEDMRDISDEPLEDRDYISDISDI